MPVARCLAGDGGELRLVVDIKSMLSPGPLGAGDAHDHRDILGARSMADTVDPVTDKVCHAGSWPGGFPLA